jgi:DNA replication and repair protein RecF
MYLKQISFQGVRNLEPGEISLSKGLNIVYGVNGAGKSSLLEAISFLTTGRSFRTTKLNLMVSDGKEQLVVFGRDDQNKPIGISYDGIKRNKLVKINGELIKALSELTALYPTQVLSPESYHLIDSGPAERRKYLDWCLFHVKQSYHQAWKNYNTILKQRNSLLKNTALSFTELESQLAIWDQQLCETAKQVNEERESILNHLQEMLESCINELSVDFCDSLSINYYAGFTGDLAEKLKSSLHSDRDSGFTKYGPHKADLRIKVNGYLAKDFLSRGQKKVLINALFLAQTLLLKSLTTKDSLFVIDDFTSELDDTNQEALLGLLLAQDNVQVILSCLQQSSLNGLKKGYNNAQLFHVERGKISPLEPAETE